MENRDGTRPETPLMLAIRMRAQNRFWRQDLLRAVESYVRMASVYDTDVLPCVLRP